MSTDTWGNRFNEDCDTDAIYSSGSDTSDLDYDPTVPCSKDAKSNYDSDSLESTSVSWSFYQRETDRLKNTMDENLLVKIKNILSYMQKEGINLPIFLDVVSWGDAQCISDP